MPLLLTASRVSEPRVRPSAARWPHREWLLALLATLVLMGCGGGSSSPRGPDPNPPRGTLLQRPPELRTQFSAAALLSHLRGVASPTGLPLDVSLVATEQILTQSGIPLCDIAVYHLRYATVGGLNEYATASGALMVPSGIDSRCRGDRPILLYAHGTSTNHAFDLSDLTVQQNAEGLFLAAFFASQGYIVVAPNYAGYDTSSLPYHAYLVAEQQSKDMIDALNAARSALPTHEAPLTSDGGRLFITGYSQGGYVAMATQRAMEASGMHVTAAAPMSGPYAIAAFVDAVFSGEVDGGAPVVMTLLTTAYQKVYSNIYASPSDVFEIEYATSIESLLPSTVTRSQLYAEGKLPQYALFSSTPPDPIYAPLTPPSTPANLAPVFALGFGTHDLVRNSFRLRYLQDAQTEPDGAWPVLTTGVPAANPSLMWRQALKRNDLRGWLPAAPVLLCGGALDPVVYFLNTQLIQSYFAAHAPASASFSMLDLEAGAVSNDPYASFKRDFGLAKNLVMTDAVQHGAKDGGALAVAEAYHTTLVAPFCYAAVKSFFANY